MPLFPQIRKHIAYHKLRQGKPVSKFTKVTKKELKDKIPLVYEAKRLMSLTTPCADNASSHNLILDDILEEITLDNEPNIVERCEIDTGVIDTNGKSKNGIETKEKGSSPIHVHLLDNELDFDSSPEYNDTSSDTSDTEYNKNLDMDHDNNIFQMDEELDIIDSEFEFN